MRVLHVIPSISPRRGGPSEVVLRLAEAQRVLGLEVEMVTSDEDHTEAREGEVVLCQDVPVRFFRRAWTGWPALREYAYCPTFPAWAHRNFYRYDVLHIHALFSHLPTTAMRLARRAGVPYVSRPLGQLGRWPLRQGARKKAIYLRLIEKKNLRGAAALHFTSIAEQEEAADLRLKVASCVVPHGVAIPQLTGDAAGVLREKLGLPPSRRIILFLGRLHAKKGLDLLLRAVALLPEPRPILLIAGEGPEQSSLRRLVVDLKLAADVRWLGQVEGNWKHLCLEGADLFALTSHHENFGVAALEALAAGTPVLLSPAVALADMVARHNLGWIAPLEPAAISRSLRAGLDATTGDHRRERRKFVEANFNWATSARALTEIYRGAAKSR
jgi:glycosyltransferase involved in cell wall biosynthesis